MKSQIIVNFAIGDLLHDIYVFTEESESVPSLCKQVPADELISAIAMTAAKFNIKNIKLSGPRAYSYGIKDQLAEKLNTCFGSAEGFTIELV